MKKKLSRTKQCEKCPWKKNSNPYLIPNNYDVEKHKALKKTIACDNTFNTKSLYAMACHETGGNEKESYCIGWLVNQLGPGNNIGLRLKMLQYDLSDVQVFGHQHRSFNDTLP